MRLGELVWMRKGRSDPEAGGGCTVPYLRYTGAPGLSGHYQQGIPYAAIRSHYEGSRLWGIRRRNSERHIIITFTLINP